MVDPGGNLHRSQAEIEHVRHHTTARTVAPSSVEIPLLLAGFHRPVSPPIILKIGKKIAMTMPPTRKPMTPIISGSIKDVRAA